jgi:hypothetical protein
VGGRAWTQNAAHIRLRAGIYLHCSFKLELPHRLAAAEWGTAMLQRTARVAFGER